MTRSLFRLLLAVGSLAPTVHHVQHSAAEDSFPIVPPDVEVALFARDPLVRNPCALTFDALGRLCVGMGPQYRKPDPDTPGDSVWILLDADGDGTADGRHEFASGFNAIQGLAWRGDQLWVANAPDLTVVRDLDDDYVADEYIRLYTDLGNLEHGLHGLNWSPDGLLYMSKGNSKGLNQPPGRVAPKPFRDLWGQTAPPGTPDFPPPVVTTRTNYQKHYHDPSDDWGLSGGILRCRPDGSNLEIVSRGYRNPWDISFDDGFHWLGTDNDQNYGDKIFSPFYGAHFGWGHPWSYDWTDDEHLPSAPAAGPFFEGSGTGVIYLGLAHYPKRYRDVFLVNDWLKRQIYIYRPRWEGAWMRSDKEALEVFAEAGRGRSMGQSEGRAFDPVDIELGPDGAVYVGSWGREYGVKMEDGRMANEGRIYRFWLRAAPPKTWHPPRESERDPWLDLSSHLPIWRTNAQETILDQGASAIPRLKKMLGQPDLTKRRETWALWTLGRIHLERASDDAFFVSAMDASNHLNRRLQSLRILAHRVRHRQAPGLPPAVREALSDPEARMRHEAVLALWQAGESRWITSLVERAAVESDRIVFYSLWGALRHLMTPSGPKALLEDPQGSVRLAATLALFEADLLSAAEIDALTRDPDPRIASLAVKRSRGKAAGIVKGPPLGPPSNSDARDDPPWPPLSVVDAIQSESGDYREATFVEGNLAYLDRDYRFHEIPPELAGETFIQVANDHAEATERGGFTLTLPTPATLFLADDVRAEALPLWARDVFTPTELQFHNGDSKMRVYRADVPPDEVTFGPNSQGVTGRKCHYHVIIQPRLLEPQTKAPTPEAVQAAMPTADAARGRTLFLNRNGATCVVCHRLENRGNVLAPNLSEIGTRAEPSFIIESILSPSAQITEGFAMQVVTLKDGHSLGGIVLEETGRALTFGLTDGSTAMVPKQDIVRRETAKISAMPMLGPLLSAQQVADLTTYLMSLGKPPSSPAGEENVSVSGETWGDPVEGFHLKGHDDRIDIQLDGQPVASYYFAHPLTRRPFFAHVKTPSGLQVTRNFPPTKGQDPMDHAYLHPGISMGFAVLDGENFWHEDRGEVRLERFLDEPIANAESAQFAARFRYLGENGRTVCREDVLHRFRKNADGYLITIDSRFFGEEKFYFGVREEMGLAIRVASPLRVKGGQGSIHSDHGGHDEKGTWGIVGKWWDYAGPLEGRHAGLQVMSGPGNPPVWAHSRDYGVLVANPFPVDRPENRDKQTVVTPDRPLRLRFGIQIHEHASEEALNASAAHARYHSLPTP